MFDKALWLSACQNSERRPRTEISSATIAGCAINVSAAGLHVHTIDSSIITPYHSYSSHFILWRMLMGPLQNFAFCISATASGVMLTLWHRLHRDNNKQLWPLYGRFTGLVLICSLLGIWLASLNCAMEPVQVSVYDTINRLALLNSSAQEQWIEEDVDAFIAEYGLLINFFETFAFYSLLRVLPEGVFLFCLNYAQLMVLERITRAAVSSVRGTPARWVLAKRITVGIIVTFHTTSFCCRLALAVLFRKLQILYQRATLTLSQDARDFTSLMETINDTNKQVKKTSGVHQVSDAVALLYTVAMFMLVGGLCARRMKQILNRSQPPEIGSTNIISLNHREEVRSILIQVITTCLFVFASLVSMASFATFQALINVDGFSDNSCPSDKLVQTCDSCHSLFDLIGIWIAFNPEFNLGFFFPSPFSLLVALWGMTSKRLLQAFKILWKHRKNSDTMMAVREDAAAPAIVAAVDTINDMAIPRAAGSNALTDKLNAEAPVATGADLNTRLI
jgi:hypothetical protein